MLQLGHLIFQVVCHGLRIVRPPLPTCTNNLTLRCCTNCTSLPNNCRNAPLPPPSPPTAITPLHVKDTVIQRLSLLHHLHFPEEHLGRVDVKKDNVVKGNLKPHGHLINGINVLH